MASTAPPSYYSSNHTALYGHAIESMSTKPADDPWTDDQKKTFLQSITTTLSDDSVLTGLKAEIDQLQASTKTIKTVFSTVKNGFQKVHDDSAVDDDFKSAVAKLIKRWSEFGTTFDGITNRAKTNASNAQVIAADFSTNFIEFLERQDKTLEAKKAEAETYKRFIKDDADKAHVTKEDLKNLVAAITAFDNDWRGVAEAEKKKLNSNIERYNTQITKLQGEIDKLTTKINWAIGALAASAAGIGICFVAGFFCPAFWYGIVISAGLAAVPGTLLASYVSQRSTKEAEKAVVQTTLNNAKQAEEDIQALLSGVASVNNESAKIFTALQAFEDVWQSIEKDLNGLMHILDLVESGSDRDLAYKRISAIKATYNRVAYAMDYYARKA